MRDTAPLAPPHAAPHGPAGRARPPFIRPVSAAPRTTTQLAHSLGKSCPWRDATLPADRQLTHFADVAPSLAARRIAQAGPVPRARKCDKASPPGTNIYPRRGWITFFELVTFFELRDSSPPGDSRPEYLHPIRPAKGASCGAPKNTTNPPRQGRSVIPGGKTKFFPGGKAFPGEAGNVFPIQGRLSPEDRSDRAILRCRSTSAGLAKLPAIAYENELHQPTRPPRPPASDRRPEQQSKLP
jgi:hypothetical protein